MTPEFLRQQEGLRWLSAEFVVSREQAQKHLGPMLAEALVSKGYAQEARDDRRMSVTEAGRRAMRDREVVGVEE